MVEASSGQAWASARGQEFLTQILHFMDSARDKEALLLAEEMLVDHELSALATTALAALYFRAGALGYAARFLLQVIDHEGAPPDVTEALAVVYCQAGNLSDGLYYGKLATTLSSQRHLLPLFGPTFPSFADAMASIRSKPLLAMGRTKLVANDLEQAKFLVEQHLCIFPNDVEALDVYAQIQIREGKLAEAIGMLRSIATLAGPSATLLNRLGNCLVREGHVQEGLACHHEAIARAPGSAVVLGSAVADLAYLDTAAALATGIPQAWIETLNAQAPKTVRPAPNFTGQSPLRIGYICAGLGEDETRAMLAAVARGHDRSRVSVIGFGAGEVDSSFNEWVRGAFEQWRNVSSLDVATLGALVRGEGIHVLVDADGILTPNKCSVFQRNCAPLQVSWLNAPAMIRLPGRFLACVPGEGGEPGQSLGLAAGRYLLADGVRPAVSSPAAQSGRITFGAELSRPEFNPRLAMAWARILQAVPNSMLLLRDTGLLQGEEAIGHVVNLLGNGGVAHRIDVIKGGDRAEFAAGLDIGLLPFPSAQVLAYGELLANGVPVVTNRSAAGGADIGAALIAAGLGEELVADGIDEYVAKAVALASHAGALDGLRGRMAPALAASPAFSAKAFAAMLEEAFLGALTQQQG